MWRRQCLWSEGIVEQCLWINYHFLCVGKYPGSITEYVLFSNPFYTQTQSKVSFLLVNLTSKFSFRPFSNYIFHNRKCVCVDQRKPFILHPKFLKTRRCRQILAWFEGFFMSFCSWWLPVMLLYLERITGKWTFQLILNKVIKLNLVSLGSEETVLDKVLAISKDENFNARL